MYCKGKSVSLLDYAVRVVESGEILSHRSDVHSIAGHNLSYMSHLLHGKEIDTEQYDAILELLALAISDIHIGTPESMTEEAIDLIRKYRPKTLILLGDIFDYNGEVRPYHVILLFSVIEGIDNIVVMRGDAEEGSKLCPHEEFLNVLDALVFSEEPWTAPLRQRFRIQRYILWFYKYNRVMRERAKVLLPSGKSVLLIHGQQLGSYTLARDKVLERARYKKAMFNADWILLGHFHRPLLSPEDGVIVLGAWQRQTENMERTGFQPAKSAVLIDEDETIEVLES